MNTLNNFVGIVIAGFALFLLCAVPGKAQDIHYYQEHPRSVELSTGPPFLLIMMYPPGNYNNARGLNVYHDGISEKAIMPINFSLAYNCQISRHWELSLSFTHSGWIYTRDQYPEKGEGDKGVEYDFNATPKNLGPKYEARGFIFTGLMRYYWFTKKPAFQLYSAAGIGYVAGLSWPVLPTLTPIGIRFGAGRWYGRAELTVGTNASLVQLGAGFRF